MILAAALAITFGAAGASAAVVTGTTQLYLDKMIRLDFAHVFQGNAAKRTIQPAGAVVNGQHR
jgi:hypothetical protein